MQFLFRPVQPDDANILHRHCWQEKHLYKIEELVQRALVLEKHRRGQGTIATYQNRLCAFGMVTLWTRVAEISDLVVEAPLRSRGIGSQIVDYLTAYAREMGAEIVEIGAQVSNYRALNLYQRLGFTQYRVLEPQSGIMTEPVIYLRKRIDSPSK